MEYVEEYRVQLVPEMKFKMRMVLRHEHIVSPDNVIQVSEFNF